MENKIINKKMFGKRIKTARENLGYTQEKLSEEIGISQNFLGDIERGVKLPSLPKLIRLANILKISLDSMFTESLDNILCEPKETYYTNRQLAIMRNIIKEFKDNF